jgi:hypothetical protein
MDDLEAPQLDDDTAREKDGDGLDDARAPGCEILCSRDLHEHERRDGHPQRVIEARPEGGQQRPKMIVVPRPLAARRIPLAEPVDRIDDHCRRSDGDESNRDHEVDAKG